MPARPEGVPVRKPVAGSRDNPSGSAPAVMRE